MADHNERKNPRDQARENMGFGPSRTRSSTVPPLLHDPAHRAGVGLPEDADKAGAYMI